MRMRKLKLKKFFVRVLACMSVCAFMCGLISCSDKGTGAEKPSVKDDGFEMSKIENADEALKDYYSYREKSEKAFLSTSPTEEKDLIYTHIDGGVRIDGYKGESDILVIPESIDGVGVIEIAEHAFCKSGDSEDGEDGEDGEDSKNSLRSIYVPDSVKKIGAGAFCECKGLQLLRLPFIGDGGDQTHIGYVFGADTYDSQAISIPVSLEMIIIGEGEDSVAPYAFYGVKSVEAILVTGAVSIGEFAFYECSELCYVGLSDELVSIGEYAFSSCTSLTRADLGDSLESIGLGAFYLCSSMTEMRLPFIGDGGEENHIGYIFGAKAADWNASFVPRSLLRVNISEACESIADKAFFGCCYIAEVNFHEGLKSIGIRAFSGCRSLTRICTPTSLEKICGDAFFGCDGLKRVEIQGATYVADQAFYGCGGIEEKIISDRAKISDNAF